MDCFHLLAIISNVAIEIHVRVFVLSCVFISFGYIPRSGISGSDVSGNVSLTFLKIIVSTLVQNLYIWVDTHMCTHMRYLLFIVEKKREERIEIKSTDKPTILWNTLLALWCMCQ